MSNTIKYRDKSFIQKKGLINLIQFFSFFFLNADVEGSIYVYIRIGKTVNKITILVIYGVYLFKKVSMHVKICWS